MLPTSITRNALWLTVSIALAVIAVVITYFSTRDLIANNQQAADEKALLTTLPQIHHDNDLLEDNVMVNDEALLGLSTPTAAYIARLHGQPIAIILPVVAHDGYGGDIELRVGVDRDGTVIGVRIVAHRETHGVGANIDHDRSGWINQFAGHSLNHPAESLWGVKRDQGAFDQFTGATVTSRAVTGAVKRALQYFTTHREVLLMENTGENIDG